MTAPLTIGLVAGTEMLRASSRIALTASSGFQRAIRRIDKFLSNEFRATRVTYLLNASVASVNAPICRCRRRRLP
jgi:hypothetical protein